MNAEIYFGNLKKYVYAGFAGNIAGATHYEIVKEGLYIVKVKDNEYISLEELLSNKEKKKTYKTYATKRGEFFVDDLVSVNDLVESYKKTK